MNTEAAIGVLENKIANIESDVKELRSDVKQISEQVLDSAKHIVEIAAVIKQSSADISELKKIVANNHDEISKLKTKVTLDKTYQDGALSAAQETDKRSKERINFVICVISAAAAVIAGYVAWHDWKERQRDKVTNSIQTTIIRKGDK